ncbi:MAG: hypothetical protein A2284_12635 [Deltaproteobacteria bacterium RIFOXYA12_FULL_61_11]|nr:MAG: hypothetical protein A2284_12635 [Deltaproteobacteria bacterium RIFOXYA12_FULL_61_11]
MALPKKPLPMFLKPLFFALQLILLPLVGLIAGPACNLRGEKTDAEQPETSQPQAELQLLTRSFGSESTQRDAAFSEATVLKVVELCKEHDGDLETCATRYLPLERHHPRWPEGLPVSHLRSYTTLIASTFKFENADFTSGFTAHQHKSLDAEDEILPPEVPEVLVPVTPVKHQGDRPTCYAFASNATIETYLLQQHNVTYDLSEQFVDLYTRHRRENATTLLPLTDGDTVPAAPIPLEDVLPYVGHSGGKLDNLFEPNWARGAESAESLGGTYYLPPAGNLGSYVQVERYELIQGDLPFDETNVYLAGKLDQGRGINATIYILAPFDDYDPTENEVIELPPDCTLDPEPVDPGELGQKVDCFGRGLHAVEIVGYRVVEGRYEFKIKNSWGPTWGLDGFGWLSAAYVQRAGWEFVTVEEASFLQGDAVDRIERFPVETYFVRSATDLPKDIEEALAGEDRYVAAYPFVVQYRLTSGTPLETTPFLTLEAGSEVKAAVLEARATWFYLDQDDPHLVRLLHLGVGDVYGFHDFSTQAMTEFRLGEERFLGEDDPLVDVLDTMVLRSGGAFLPDNGLPPTLGPGDDFQLWLCRGSEYCIGNLAVEVELEQDGEVIERFEERRAHFNLTSLISRPVDGKVSPSDQTEEWKGFGGFQLDRTITALTLRFRGLSRRILVTEE